MVHHNVVCGGSDVLVFQSYICHSTSTASIVFRSGEDASTLSCQIPCITSLQPHHNQDNTFLVTAYTSRTLPYASPTSSEIRIELANLLWVQGRVRPSIQGYFNLPMHLNSGGTAHFVAEYKMPSALTVRNLLQPLNFLGTQ